MDQTTHKILTRFYTLVNSDKKPRYSLAIIRSGRKFGFFRKERQIKNERENK